MLHLLPQYQKRKVIREYRSRGLTVAGYLSSVIVGSAIVFLLPTYFFLLSERDVLQTQKEAYISIIERGGAGEGKEKIDVSGSLASLTVSGDTLQPLSYIDALSLVSKNVRIDSYSFVQQQRSAPVSVSVSGMASKRDELSAFAKTLDEVFGNVKLPLSSLAKQSDIPFDFKFMMNNQKVEKLLSTSTTPTYE